VCALKARNICDFDTHIFVISAHSKRLKAQSLAQKLRKSSDQAANA
jgi:hypothetical protein